MIPKLNFAIDVINLSWKLFRYRQWGTTNGIHFILLLLKFVYLIFVLYIVQTKAFAIWNTPLYIYLKQTKAMFVPKLTRSFKFKYIQKFRQLRIAVSKYSLEASPYSFDNHDKPIYTNYQYKRRFCLRFRRNSGSQ